MTKTIVLPVEPTDVLSAQSQASLHQAASILRDGGTVAFPTETVYGLGANAWDAVAVQRIFEAKQRPAWDPLIVHIDEGIALEEIAAVVSQVNRTLIEAFWPGPLTLLLPKRNTIPDIVTAGRPTVGVRMPAHPVARALIGLARVPLAAPSANSFGRTSPTTAQHVLEDLDGRIDAVLDGGATNLGLESTVIDANAEPAVIYRHGMISIEQIRRYLPDVVAFADSAAARLIADRPQSALPSPGVGLRHYAPKAQLILVPMEQWESVLRQACGDGGQTGVLLPDEFPAPMNSGITIFRWGKWEDPDELAQRLFAGLRYLDTLSVKRILCPMPQQDGIGSALRDRLRKAARPVEVPDQASQS